MTRPVLESLQLLLRNNYKEQVEQLELLSENPNFCRELVEIALSNQQLSDRQFAAVTLKNFIHNRWSLRSEGYAGSSLPPDQVKAFVRSFVLQGLCDPNVSIRSTLVSLMTRLLLSLKLLIWTGRMNGQSYSTRSSDFYRVAIWMLCMDLCKYSLNSSMTILLKTLSRM
jgi:hypothetical protein